MFDGNISAYQDTLDEQAFIERYVKLVESFHLNNGQQSSVLQLHIDDCVYD